MNYGQSIELSLVMQEILVSCKFKIHLLQHCLEWNCSKQFKQPCLASSMLGNIWGNTVDACFMKAESNSALETKVNIQKSLLATCLKQFPLADPNILCTP